MRNGGFERGNTDFWDVIGGGSLEVTTVSPLHGTYCGKFTADGTADGVILSSDYIDVKPYQIVDGILYMKSGTTDKGYLDFYAYDADYSLIGIQTGSWVTNDGSYLMLTDQYAVPVGCAYVRFGIQIHSPTNGDVIYLDGGGVEIIDSGSAMSGMLELLPAGSYTVSDNTWERARSMMQFSTYYADLHCTYVGGTSPTLDVDVIESLASGGVITVGSFTTVTGTTAERIVLSNCLGKKMYLVYTIGGTNPEFDFEVAAVGKR